MSDKMIDLQYAETIINLRAEVERLKEVMTKIENIYLFDDNPPEPLDMRIWNIIRDAQGKPR